MSRATAVSSGVEDYYAGDAEPAGRWCGRSAAQLGLWRGRRRGSPCRGSSRAAGIPSTSVAALLASLDRPQARSNASATVGRPGARRLRAHHPQPPNPCRLSSSRRRRRLGRRRAPRAAPYVPAGPPAVAGADPLGSPAPSPPRRISTPAVCRCHAGGRSIGLGHGRSARSWRAPGCRTPENRADLRLSEALPRDVAPGPLEKPENAKSPAGRGFSECAEEDSNLHPVIPDQALKSVGA
jgi:hypothetical protein